MSETNGKAERAGKSQAEREEEKQVQDAMMQRAENAISEVLISTCEKHGSKIADKHAIALHCALFGLSVADKASADSLTVKSELAIDIAYRAIRSLDKPALYDAWEATKNVISAHFGNQSNAAKQNSRFWTTCVKAVNSGKSLMDYETFNGKDGLRKAMQESTPAKDAIQHLTMLIESYPAGRIPALCTMLANVILSDTGVSTASATDVLLREMTNV